MTAVFFVMPFLTFDEITLLQLAYFAFAHLLCQPSTVCIMKINSLRDHTYLYFQGGNVIEILFKVLQSSKYVIVCQQLIMMVHKDVSNCDGRPSLILSLFSIRYFRHSAQKGTLRPCNCWNQQSILMLNHSYIGTL